MRVRYPFAIAFSLITLLSAYLGFSSIHPPINDKLLHFATFFLLTLTFYWILETTRRRAVNITCICITLLLSPTSEFIQPLINPSRPFDPYDILSNILGSLTALLLNAWYHKRMLSRKREQNKTRYTSVATDEPTDPDGDLEHGLDVGAEELSDLESSERTRGETEGTSAAGK